MDAVCAGSLAHALQWGWYPLKGVKIGSCVRNKKILLFICKAHVHIQIRGTSVVLKFPGMGGQIAKNVQKFSLGGWQWIKGWEAHRLRVIGGNTVDHILVLILPLLPQNVHEQVHTPTVVSPSASVLLYRESVVHMPQICTSPSRPPTAHSRCVLLHINLSPVRVWVWRLKIGFHPIWPLQTPNS